MAGGTTGIGTAGMGAGIATIGIVTTGAAGRHADSKSKTPREAGFCLFDRSAIGADGSGRRDHDRTTVLNAARRRYSAAPNSVANRFSPFLEKLTTRLPGVTSRAAHFNSVKRSIKAAPKVPAR